MSISSAPYSPATVAKPLRQRSLLGDAMRRFSRNRLAMVGLAIVTLVVLAALLADFIAPFPYDAVDLMATNQKPSAAHWMGTDEVGRDVFSRIIFGARISLGVGLAVQAIALFIGVPLGLAAGMLGGKVDFVVMRLVEIMTSIPTLMMALLLIAIFGGGVVNVIIAIGLVGWLDTCRLVRAQLLTLRERDYVLAHHRRRRHAHRLPSPVAQRHWADHRGADHRHSHGDVCRGRSLLSGAWR
jgi:oligopeptide transport system permease protein